MISETPWIKGVVFDLDGTLTQTSQLIYDSFNYITEKYIQKRLTPEEIVALFGPPEQGAVEKVVGTENIDTIMTEYYNFYEHYHDRASLFPGIDELLSTLHSRSVPVGLYTGKGRRTTTITLDKFNLTRYFDSIVTGDDVTQFKPSGEGLQKILQQFSLQPEHLLMVGDSLADVKASRATGVKIAAALWDSNSKEKVLQAKPDYVFYAVDAFRAWLQSAVM